MLCNSSPQVVQFVSSSCAIRLLKLCASPQVLQCRLLKLCSCPLLLCGGLLLLCTCLLLLCGGLLLLCRYFWGVRRVCLLKICTDLVRTPTVSVLVTGIETVSDTELVPDTVSV